jgi:hypothetical protein
MKISNTPPGPNRPGPTDGPERTSSKGAEFRVPPETSSAGAFSGIRSRYASADLRDATKAEAAIRESLEAILREQPVASRLPEEHRQKLLDFMQADPSVRSKITSYLEKILS